MTGLFTLSEDSHLLSEGGRLSSKSSRGQLFCRVTCCCPTMEEVSSLVSRYFKDIYYPQGNVAEVIVWWMVWVCGW